MDPSQLPSSELKARTGLSAVPQIRDRAQFMSMLKRHDPGLGGTILIDVSVDENGVVQNVSAVPPQISSRARAVFIDRSPTGRVVEHSLPIRNNPELLPAAQAALREVRFTPAERDGRAVPFKLRMTLGFDSPSGQ
jgi:hypothetical protein